MSVSQHIELLNQLNNVRRIPPINKYLQQQNPKQLLKRSYFQFRINAQLFTFNDVVAFADESFGRIVNVFESDSDEKYVMAEMYAVCSGTAEFCVAFFKIRKINQITHKVKICDNQTEFDSYECVNGEQKILCQFQKKNGKQDPIKPKYTNAYKMNKQKESLDHLNKIQNSSEQKQPELRTTNRPMNNEQQQAIQTVGAINGTSKNQTVSTQKEPQRVQRATPSNSLNKSSEITENKHKNEKKSKIKSIDDDSSKINTKPWGIPSGDDSSSESDESDGDASMNQNNANTNNKQSIEFKNKNVAISNKVKPKKSIPAISNGAQRERQNDGPKPKANGLKFNQDSNKSMFVAKNKRIANRMHSKNAIKIRKRKRDQQNAAGPDDGNGKETKSNPVNADNRKRQNYGGHATKLQQSRPKVKLVEPKNKKISSTMPSTKAITSENSPEIHKRKRNNGNNLKANPLKSKEAMKGNKKIEKNLIGSKNNENSDKMEKTRPRKRRRSSISEFFTDNQLRVPKKAPMHKTKRRRLSENDVSNQCSDQKDALINKLNRKIKLKDEAIAGLRKQLKQKENLIEQLKNPEEVLNALSVVQKFAGEFSIVLSHEKTQNEREAKV